MTTFRRKDVTCANCRKSSTHQVLGSTNAFGSPDLDLRPPEMQRSTIEFWLQLCPHCGYVAPDLSEPIGDMAVILGPEYQGTLIDQRFPELARRFLAHALLAVTLEPVIAASARLRAAWVCDDSRQLELAGQCRRLAAECFTALKPFEDSEKGITQGAVFVDVLRRAGEFDRAVAECDALLARPQATGILRQVLDYQRRLASGRDTTAHRVEECTR
jgi:hypothetical protein